MAAIGPVKEISDRKFRLLRRYRRGEPSRQAYNNYQNYMPELVKKYEQSPFMMSHYASDIPDQTFLGRFELSTEPKMRSLVGNLGDMR
jgi:hypothetical protein